MELDRIAIRTIDVDAARRNHPSTATRFNAEISATLRKRWARSVAILELLGDRMALFIEPVDRIADLLGQLNGRLNHIVIVELNGQAGVARRTHEFMQFLARRMPTTLCGSSAAIAVATSVSLTEGILGANTAAPCVCAKSFSTKSTPC